MRSISGASARMTAGSAWVSSSVKSTMLIPLFALRVKAAWQPMEQNQRRVRVGRGRRGSNQPKPRVRAVQTAQSTGRGRQDEPANVAPVELEGDQRRGAIAGEPVILPLRGREILELFLRRRLAQ